MQYIYHHVPNDLQGNILYPLNTLKKIYPSAYKHQISKYKGREHVREQHIPLFNDCLWNDVLFLTATDPREIFDTRRKAGWPDNLGPHRYFKIDVTQLDQSRLGVYLFKPKNQPTGLTDSDFAAYNDGDLENYALIPNATKEYFENEFDAGEPYIRLFYRYIPHILYYGEIDVTNSEIVIID